MKAFYNRCCLRRLDIDGIDIKQLRFFACIHRLTHTRISKWLLFQSEDLLYLFFKLRFRMCNRKLQLTDSYYGFYVHLSPAPVLLF